MCRQHYIPIGFDYVSFSAKHGLYHAVRVANDSLPDWMSLN